MEITRKQIIQGHAPTSSAPSAVVKNRQARPVSVPRCLASKPLPTPPSLDHHAVWSADLTKKIEAIYPASSAHLSIYRPYSVASDPGSARFSQLSISTQSRSRESELFFEHTQSASSVTKSADEALSHMMAVVCMSKELPLPDFLEWIGVNYNIDRLLPHYGRQSKYGPVQLLEEPPVSTSATFARYRTLYDPSNLNIQDGHTFKIIHTIHSALTRLTDQSLTNLGGLNAVERGLDSIQPKHLQGSENTKTPGFTINRLSTVTTSKLGERHVLGGLVLHADIPVDAEREDSHDRVALVESQQVESKTRQRLLTACRIFQGKARKEQSKGSEYLLEPSDRILVHHPSPANV